MEKSCYPAYKDSGVPWLGNIPKQWDVVPIKFTLDIPITDGPHETPKLYSEGIPFLSAEAVKEDRLDFNKKRGFITEDEHTRFSKKYKPKKGDVYMVKSGATTGNVARVETDEEFNIWSPLAALRPNNKVITTDFIFYFMKSKPFFYSVELSWSYGTQQNIGMGVISNLKMALPPVGEQLKITEFLNSRTSQIDRLIEKKKALIEKLNEKRIALITQAVTKGLNLDVPMKPSGVDWLGDVPAHWKIMKLSHVVRLKSGESITSLELKLTGEYPVYGGNGHRGFFDEYTHEGEYVLIGRQGALCGNINYASGKFWASEHAVVITPDRPVSTLWLGELLRIMNLGQYSVSAAQPGISVEMISRLKIPYPPIEEQEEIAGYISRDILKNQQLIDVTQGC